MDTLFEQIALANIEAARTPLLPVHHAPQPAPAPAPEDEAPAVFELAPGVPLPDEEDVDEGFVTFSSRLVRPGCLYSGMPQRGSSLGLAC